ncbi:hypothetical protein [Pseudoalteromonas denitrificans]|uniref:Two-component system, OmpR family, catabolic regulation response regulator CreB n=1 Tax=Pseudoalteromonas denitrificans DSM 6059 TaxID=1123010 RepID=A0A1I1T330_9GAMM|nr:hypothetical protein [Pseudoalteromonas denitrificans]SFD53066.1 two-component system, OmpR family, catabolic regulation response regulator CreB [Pseudoalteromonas denitrificans DSM 6059]
MNILLIEDESAIADTLIHVLALDGFNVNWVDTGEAVTWSTKFSHPS